MSTHRRKLRRLVGQLLAVAFVLSVGPVTGQVQPTLAPAEVDRVLVYSTQARVFRAATVALTPQSREVALADLPDAVVPDTVRVESKTAEVSRVVVERVRGRLPRQVKAKELVKKIEEVTDKLRDLADEKALLDGEYGFVRSLVLRREPSARTARPPAEGLFTDAWRRVLTWMEARLKRIQVRLAQLAVEQRQQRESLHKLEVEAKDLDPAAMNQVVSRVTATLRGPAGKHRVVVSYLVTNVRWVPSYDLRYVPARRAVEATYYAVVDQQTGEDWPEARMRFSTGLPTQLLAVPELPTWTVGRKRDFTPTPRARVELAPNPWVPSPPSLVADPALESLQQALAQARTPAAELGDRDGDGVQDSEDQCPSEPEVFNGIEDSDGCPDRGRVMVPPSKPRPAPDPEPVPSRRPMEERDALDDLVDSAVGGKRAPVPSQAPAAPPPAEPAIAELSVRAAADVAPAGRARFSFSGLRSSGQLSPQESLPWTDVGYRPPVIDPDLPGASAKGYIFTLYAPGRHTIAASGQRQRVPVLRRTLQVKPIYQVRPGLSQQAYLVAEVKNTTGRPILRGHANLFAGEMFSGRSWLNTALPGKMIKLPLGVDDAIKIERHLRQKTVVQGVLFKDDVTEYTVEIQLANHHGYPIRVEVQDQVPVELGRKIEVKAFSSKSGVTKPDEQGRVTWEGTVKGRSVEKLFFSFQIVRPKDWEVRQSDG